MQCIIPGIDFRIRAFPVIGTGAEESVYDENRWRSDNCYFLHVVIYFDP
jgi:hypothetical protein